jgi:quercetin 2,3-dioxygenase
MIRVRKASERGHFDHGWLDTYHTFSFASYYDPEHVQFRDLRVINEDRVQPGRGFGTHPHRDMEIITYVVSGALGHRDSMGHDQSIQAGEVQAMTAGTGITHSEYNHAEDAVTHLLQIWILPSREGLEPRYDQRRFTAEEKRGRLKLIVSGDGREDSLPINQDVDLYASILAAGESLDHQPGKGRHAWIQVVRGGLEVNGTQLAAGDGAAVSDEQTLHIAADKESEFLLFDLR